MNEWIEQREWDSLCLCPCEDECGTDVIGFIKYELRYVTPFDEEVERTLDRLYGPFTKSDWMALLSSALGLSFETKRFLIERHDLDVNQPLYGSVDFLEAEVYRSAYEDVMPNVHFLLSRGANVNLQQDWSGRSVLRLGIEHLYFGTNRPSEEMDKQMIRADNMIRWLLEQGADPLLEDREGVNTIQFVERTQANNDVKQRLLVLLEEYCG